MFRGRTLARSAGYPLLAGAYKVGGLWQRSRQRLAAWSGRTGPEERCRAFAALGGLALGALFAASRPRLVDCSETSARIYPKDLEQLVRPTKANPVPVTVPPPFPGLAKQQWSQRHVAPILGLPLKGKTYVAQSLKRYVEFFHGARAQIFDISTYLEPGGDDRLYRDLETFFGSTDCSDPYAFKQAGVRMNCGGFAILLCGDDVESTDSMWSAHTKWNRRWLSKKLDELGAQVYFIELQAEGAKGEQYVRDLTKHRGVSLEESRDLIARYQDHFVSIQMDGSENDSLYMRLLNYNETMIVNKMMRTFVGSHVCHFISNLHPYGHTRYLTRHGESEFNVQQRLGGDSSLSRRGAEYARRLAEFSRYIVTGRATDLVCVTLTAQEIERLAPMLSEDDDRGVVSAGDWRGFGDASGAEVRPEMRLLRLQRGWGAAFEDAPRSLAPLLRRLRGGGLATLVFVEGDTRESGKVAGRLWTSSLVRTIETAQFFDHGIVKRPDGKEFFQMQGRQYRNMDEVYAGEYDGLTEQEIEERAPDVIADRKRDKLGFRYPRGESYYDLIARLESVLSHLERIEEPILLISQQAILRLTYGWLMHHSPEESLGCVVPQHAVIKICYDGLGGPPVETRFPLGPTILLDDGQKNF